MILYFAKLYCRKFRSPGPTNSSLVARANRENRWDHIFKNSGRHALRWTEKTSEADAPYSMVGGSGRHSAGHYPEGTAMFNMLHNWAIAEIYKN